jgi:hypothetical protein
MDGASVAESAILPQITETMPGASRADGADEAKTKPIDHSEHIRRF